MDERMAVEYRPVKELVPYARNPRTHSAEQVRQIVDSIHYYRWTNPLLVDEGGGLIAGHGRVLAASQIYRDKGKIFTVGGDELPAGTVPIIVARGWTEAQKKAYVVADNKLALNAGWDEALLRMEFLDLRDMGFDLNLTGFDNLELSAIFKEPNKESASLADRFLIAPFSVLNAREGWWQERKRAWIGLGIQSELGRGENALQFSETVLEPNPLRRAGNKGRKASAIPGGGSGSNSVYMFKQADGRYESDAQRRARSPDAVASSNLTFTGGQARRPDLDEGTKAILASGPKRAANAIPGGQRGGMNPATNPIVAKSMSMAANRAKISAKAIGTQDWVQGRIEEGDIDGGMASGQSGTSIFDPVLCELAYLWFCPPAGQVLDPFAGGSVRGIVASRLGRNYLGVDLRPEQAAANEAQAARICQGYAEPQWIVGDALDAMPEIEADFIFSCPPYGDLERYSDDPRDLSTMSHEDFRSCYWAIIERAIARLKADRFACFVVGDFRDEGGFYAGFIGDTIAAFEAAGTRLYNEAILVTAAGSLPIRAAKQFSTSRKLGKTHQNVLVFVKGDPRKATKACGEVEVSDDMLAGAEGESEGEAGAWGEKL